MRVILLGRRQHFTDVIYWSLNLLCFVLLRSLHHHHCADHPTGCCNVEHHRLLLNRGSQNRRGGEHALELSECFFCLACPSELLCFLHQLVQRDRLLTQPTEKSAE